MGGRLQLRAVPEAAWQTASTCTGRLTSWCLPRYRRATKAERMPSFHDFNRTELDNRRYVRVLGHIRLKERRMVLKGR